MVSMVIYYTALKRGSLIKLPSCGVGISLHMASVAERHTSGQLTMTGNCLRWKISPLTDQLELQLLHLVRIAVQKYNY
jgi:hypothetical protein